MKSFIANQLKVLCLTFLFGLGVLCLCTTQTLTMRMGQLTIEQIIFHLRTPLAGVTPSLMIQWCFLVEQSVIWIVLFWLLCSGLLTWVLALVSGGRCNLKRWTWHCSLCITCGMWLTALITVFVNHDIGAFINNLRHPSTMIDRQYVRVSEKDFQKQSNMRNLVVIVSESLEATYQDESKFGRDLLAELTRLETDEICFRGQIMVNGTGSTISSISAMLYGLPHLLVGREGWHNYLHGNIFHGNLSILHILHQQGYAIWHMQGGNLDFADTRSLFEDFPDAHLFGHAELKQEPDYQELVRKHMDYGWGVNDAIMLRVARRKLTEAAQRQTPFVMSISTLDSHYDGFLDETSQREFGDFRDIVRAQSRMLADFIRWIKAQPFGVDTTIVLVGDHYVMRTQVGTCDMSTLTNGTSLVDEHGGMPERTVYSCIFNALQKAPENAKRRLFCSFDWAPTILECMGFHWGSHRFGLGVSLFSGEQTLLEKVGGKVYERESRRSSETYGKILTSGKGK